MKEHGWLLNDLLKFDAHYHVRFEVWRHTMETGEIIEVQPIQFLHYGDRAFDDCLGMVLECLKAIPKSWMSADSRDMPFFIDWLLYGFGHPLISEPPPEPYDGSGERLGKALDLEVLVAAPGDYLGHILATEKYGQWGNGKFYPTWQGCAHFMAETAVHTMVERGKFEPPFHAFDPCIGTGRLSMEMSNHCRSLFGWDRDHFLLKVALLNFMIWCPDFALPIPELGGDLVWGDSLTGVGESLFCPERLYRECPVKLSEPVYEPPKVSRKKVVHQDENALQGSLF